MIRGAHLLLAPLLGALLIALPPATWARAEEPAATPAWDTPGTLQQALDAAIAAVEDVAEARFQARPTVRRSLPKEVLEVLREELHGSWEEANLGATMEMLSHGLLAKYAPEAHVVHVLPTNTTHLAKLLQEPGLTGEDVLRVVMAHEVAHALDFQRFPELDRRRREVAADTEAAIAAGAVSEGHAQWVAQRVAARWGLDDAFKRFTRTITAIPPGLEPVQEHVARAAAAEMGFAYVQGQAFCEAVFAARGRAGLEQALADPPRTREAIERPAHWLDPSKAPKTTDLAPYLALLEPLAVGEGWQTQELPLTRNALEAQLMVLPEAERKGGLDGYVQGSARASQREEPQGYASGALLVFEDSARAKQWIDLSRRLSKAKDETFTTGAIRLVEVHYDDLPGVPPDMGLGTRKRVELPQIGAKWVHTIVFAFGATVAEVSVMEPDEAQKKVLEELPAAYAKLAEGR
jgi:hypothetical protein